MSNSKRISIKPLSVNQAWQGKRFKTPTYKAYEGELLLKLPAITVHGGDLALDIKFGFSSTLSDIDNPLKPFIDILQKKYSFDDKQIKRLVINKELVAKGSEYIEFEITEFAYDKH